MVPLRLSSEGELHPMAEDMLSNACGGALEYAHPAGCAAAAARRHRRVSLELGSNYSTEAEVLAVRISNSQRAAESAMKQSKTGYMEGAWKKRDTVKGSKTFNWSAPDTATGDLPSSFWDDNVESSPLEPSDPYEGDSTLWQHMRPIRFPDDRVAGKNADDEGFEKFASYLDSYDRAIDLSGLRHIRAGDIEPIKVGDILLTHPLACWRQPNLDRVLVLVDSVDTSIDYVRGMVLGVPNGSSLGVEVNGRRVSVPDREALSKLEALLDLPLFWGGDLRERGLRASLNWLHTFDHAALGAREIAPSVWLGGDLSVLAELAKSSPSRHRIQPIQGYLGWSSARLQSELHRGLWIRVRCNSAKIASTLCLPPQELASKDHFVNGPMKRQPGSPAIGWGAALRAIGLHCLADFPRSRSADFILETLLGLKSNNAFSLVGLEPMPVHQRRPHKFSGGKPSRRQLLGK